MKILIISGSLRQNSYNTVLANLIQKTLNSDSAQNVQASILNYKDVPFFSQDLESSVPEAVASAKAAVLEADAVWVVTPEYNGMIPGVLKNLLDWLSRPLPDAKNWRDTAVFGKPVAISGAAGKNAAAGSMKQLETLLTFMGMKVYPKACGIAVSAEDMKNDALSADALKQAEQSIKEHAEGFIDWIHTL